MTARIPPCGCITSVGECLGYVPGPQAPDDYLRSVARRAHDALLPGGVFVFDLLEPWSRHAEPALFFREGDDWACLSRRGVTDDLRFVTREVTVFRRVGRLWRRSFEKHWVRTFRCGDVLAMLREAGFAATTLRRYGTFPLRAGHCAYVATKSIPTRRNPRPQRRTRGAA